MITTPRIVRPRLRDSGRRDGVIRGVSFHIKRIMRAPARSLKQSAMRGMRFGKGIILVGGCLSFFLLLFFLFLLSLSLSLLFSLPPFFSSSFIRVVFIAWRVLAERSYLRISWILHALYNYSCVEIQNARLIKDGERRCLARAIRDFSVTD